MTEFQYEIDGKKYFQKPLVLGQIRQLLAILKNIKIQSSGPNQFLLEMGDQVPEFLAIVLIEEGKSPKDKNLKELAAEIEFAIDPDMAIRMIEDFFDCNPTASFLERIGNLGKMISAKIKQPAPGTGSKSSPSSSAGEILPDGTKSSGDTIPTNASPLSDIL